MAEEGGYHTLYEWKNTYGRNFRRVLRPNEHIAVDHFKWTSSVKLKLHEREQTFKKQGIRWWVQSAKMRTFLEKNQNTILVTSPELECKSASFRNAAPVWLPAIKANPVAFALAEQFTVILMAYSESRHKNQNMILSHFGAMRRVYEIIFIWNSPEVPLPEIPSNTIAPINIVRAPTNSLNNRWNRSLFSVKTNAVLMLDDDLLLPVQAVKSLFLRWQLEPDRLVGLTGRNFVQNDYIFPKHCCRYFEKNVALCKGSPSNSQTTWCDSLLPGRQGQAALTMDNFCDSFRLVLPKVRQHIIECPSLFVFSYFEKSVTHMQFNGQTE